MGGIDKINFPQMSTLQRRAEMNFHIQRPHVVIPHADEKCKHCNRRDMLLNDRGVYICNHCGAGHLK